MCGTTQIFIVVPPAGTKFHCVSILSCSMNTNVRIVFGLQLQAGVQPFMRKRGPSSLKLVRMIWITDYRDHRSAWPEYVVEEILLTLPPDPAADALWILLLSTSAGAQIVVATVPAKNEARVCVRISSLRPPLARRWCFAVEYLDKYQRMSSLELAYDGTNVAICPTSTMVSH